MFAYRDCGVEAEVLYFAMQSLPWGSLDSVLAHRESFSGVKHVNVEYRFAAACIISMNSESCTEIPNLATFPLQKMIA